jgi:hypothetical protein
MLLSIRFIGGSPWISLLSILLLYNMNVHWGFVGYLFAIPVFFLLFSFLLLNLRSNKIHYDAAVAITLIVLIFIHPLTGLFALSYVILCCIWMFRSQFHILVRKLLPAIPALIVASVWWFSERSQGEVWTFDFVREYYLNQYAESLSRRFELLSNDHSFLFAGSTGVWMGVAFSLFLIVPALPKIRHRFSDAHVDQAPGNKIPALILVVFSLVCWLFLPGFVRGQTHIFDRFSVFVMLGLLLYGGSVISGSTKWLRVWVVLACIIYTVCWSQYFSGFKSETAGFTQEIFPSSESGTLCGVIYESRYRGRRIYQHFPTYFITWKKGIACARFIDLRYSPAVRRKADFDLLPRYIETPAGNLQKSFVSYSIFDSILVKLKTEAQAPTRVRHLRLKRSRSPWHLYQRY